MSFSCQIHFRGLVVFAFDRASRSNPQGAKALLPISEVGERSHRPLLSYFPTQLDPTAVPVAPDPLQVTPEGSTFAFRELKNEVLFIEPTFASLQIPSLSLNPGGAGKPRDLNQAATLQQHRTCFDFVPDLARADARMVQPELENGLVGILESCLQTPIPDGAPIGARMELNHGDLQANPYELDGRWTFRKLSSAATSSPIDQPLSESAVLVLENLESLCVRSSNGDDLKFQGKSGPVQLTLSNEEYMDFSGTAGRGDDYAQLYKVFRWSSGRLPPFDDRFVPHDISFPDTIREQLCGVAMVIGTERAQEPRTARKPSSK